MNILIPALVLAGIGFVLGFLIYIVEKYFHVEEDTRLQTIQSMLPGVNCGACGFPGCAGLANAIFEGKGKPNQCKPISADKRSALEAYLKEAFAAQTTSKT
jgi:Na+-translocating ferredoxin:NAD+ oxidoreductase RNF subunit RnfB